MKANIDTEWGAVPVRGNVGVQIQRADQSSNANYWDSTRPAGSNVRPLENGKTYTDVLPSLNLAFSLANEQNLRVALARQVARPRVDEMRASLEFGVDSGTGRPGASGGNPELDPWRANAFDISYEKYFGEKAYVAAAYFYKDLRSYIFTQTQTDYDFSEFLRDYVPPVGSPPVQTTGAFTRPYNGKGGMLQGVELSASLPLDLLWQPLQGFGIVASCSWPHPVIGPRARCPGANDCPFRSAPNQVPKLSALARARHTRSRGAWMTMLRSMRSVSMAVVMAVSLLVSK